MSAIEMKSEVIRLVNEMGEDLMADLLSSIKVFMEQQEPSEIDANAPGVIKSLNDSLNEIGQNALVSNEKVIKETKKWLSR